MQRGVEICAVHVHELQSVAANGAHSVQHAECLEAHSGRVGLRVVDSILLRESAGHQSGLESVHESVLVGFHVEHPLAADDVDTVLWPLDQLERVVLLDGRHLLVHRRQKMLPVRTALDFAEVARDADVADADAWR